MKGVNKGIIRKNVMFEANSIQVSGGFCIPRKTSLSKIPAIVSGYPTSNFRVNSREYAILAVFKYIKSQSPFK
jgi:hypothetical protein